MASTSMLSVAEMADEMSHEMPYEMADKNTLSDDVVENVPAVVEPVHPLQRTWEFWIHPQHNTSWSLDSYSSICKFTTVEEMCAVMSVLPREFVQKSMLFIMKKGIAPMWEDPQNRNGGAFSYQIANEYVPDNWERLVYSVLGEYATKNTEISNAMTGITISPKKGYCILKIWMNTCAYQNPCVITSMGSAGCLFKKHNSK